MSNDEGAARAQSRQPTPLFDTTPGRRDPDRERTPPRGLGAHTIRAPLLQTRAMNQEDNRTVRRRRDSGSEERRTLRWERSPSPLADGRHSRSPIPDVTEGPLYSRIRDLPAHLRTGSREHATDAPLDGYIQTANRSVHTRPSRPEARGRISPASLWNMSNRLPNSPTGLIEGKPRKTMNMDDGDDIGHNGVRYVHNAQVTTDNARLLSHDRENQHVIIHPPYDNGDNRNVLGSNDYRNTYTLRNDTHHSIPSDSFANARVRELAPDTDMRLERETTAQQHQDLVKLVSQLRSEIPSLLPVPNPPATLADCVRISIITPLTVTRPHTALVIPLPTPPVVPTGEPLHYDSNTRPRRHTIKLESYAGQGAPLEAFLAKFEEH